MKTFVKYLTLFFLVISFIWACKRSPVNEFVGPQLSNSAELKVPFQANLEAVDFADNDSNKVIFSGAFESEVRWMIQIKGLTSGAIKTIRGKSAILPADSVWMGSQDALYFFRNNELAVASLSIDNSIKGSNISEELYNRGDILIDESIIARDTILIVNRKPEYPNQVAIFPKYARINDCNAAVMGRLYTAGYDIEPSPILDMDPSIRTRQSSSGTLVEVVGDSSLNMLEYSAYQGGIFGPHFFMLKGQDETTKVVVDKGPDYYIGRLMSADLKVINPKNRGTFGGNVCTSGPGLNVTALMEQAGTPEKLFFNVFVYGNGDGSKINYTIKEDDDNNDRYEDNLDESYEFAIVVDFKGWKLISIPYSSFQYVAWKDPQDGIIKPAGNKVKEIWKIINVQFGLVAGTLGGKGQMIIDYPTVSWGAPYRY